jgi:hypothetical protein
VNHLYAAVFLTYPRRSPLLIRIFDHELGGLTISKSLRFNDPDASLTAPVG